MTKQNPVAANIATHDRRVRRKMAARPSITPDRHPPHPKGNQPPRANRLSLAAALSLAVAGVGSFSGVAHAGAMIFDYTGNIVTWTVPSSGIYEITATGAEGGSFNTHHGGEGAFVSGDFALTAGQVLDIAVGGTGSTATNAAGGGGGSFVVLSGSNTPLAIAGGGGGASAGTNGGAALTGTNGGTGQAGQGGSGGNFNAALGGTNGLGGQPGLDGGGGAGFLGNGQVGQFDSPSLAAQSFLNGAAGSPGNAGIGAGGFGGGGYSGGGADGGGGGGYSGGGGSGFLEASGGGGSFLANTALDQILTADVGTGDGEVTITNAPEPGSAAILGLALFGMVGIRRRLL